MKKMFEEHTGLCLASAVAGGYLLSLTLKSCRKESVNFQGSPFGTSDGGDEPTSSHHGVEKFVAKHFGGVTETLENILDGLVAVGSKKLVSVFSDAIPGFQGQYEERERAREQGREHMKRNAEYPETEFSR